MIIATCYYVAIAGALNGNALMDCVNEFGFKTEIVLPFAATSVTSIYIVDTELPIYCEIDIIDDVRYGNCIYDNGKPIKPKGPAR